MRKWWPHFGQTCRLRLSSARYSCAEQPEHLTHKPSGTECLRFSVRMRDGINLSNQLIPALETKPPRMIAESLVDPSRHVLVPRQTEPRRIQDFDERQSLRRRRDAGLAAVA